MNELEFYSKNDFSRYVGQWIALDNEKLIAHGFILKEVFEEANSKSKNPFFIKVPDDSLVIL